MPSRSAVSATSLMALKILWKDQKADDEPISDDDKDDGNDDLYYFEHNSAFLIIKN